MRLFSFLTILLCSMTYASLLLVGPKTNAVNFYSLHLVHASSQAADMGLASNLNFDSANSFWISCWIYPIDDGVSADFPIFVRKALSNGRGYYLSWNGTGETTVGAVQIGIINANGVARIIVYSNNSTVPANQWSNVIMSYDGSSTAAGVKAWSNATALTLNVLRDNLSGTIQESSDDAFIGKADFGTFNGYITQCAVGAGTISNSDATTIYNSGVPLNTNSWGAATATSWWALQNGYNDSVDSNNGSGVNSPTFSTSFYP